MARHVWRVLIDGKPVRHYQTWKAAFNRAERLSDANREAEVTVERSKPVAFEAPDGSVAVCGYWRDGVRR